MFATSIGWLNAAQDVAAAAVALGFLVLTVVAKHRVTRRSDQVREDRSLLPGGTTATPPAGTKDPRHADHHTWTLPRFLTTRVGRSATVGMVVVLAATVSLGTSFLRTAPAEGLASGLTSGGGSVSPDASSAGHVVSGDVVVGTTAGVGRVAADSIGLSFEQGALGSAAFAPSSGLATLLRRLGPGLLRFGGSSVDAGPATRLTAVQLSDLRHLAIASGWRVLASIDLAHYSATVTRENAAALQTALGPRLAAIACGNEPDFYSWQRYRPATYGFHAYLADVSHCLSAVRQRAPGVELAGPDTAITAWLPRYIANLHSTVSTVTTHYYPMTACPGKYASATALIGGNADARTRLHLARSAAKARAAGVALRLDETNSASCRGIRGLSNSYAAALWAADDIFVVLGTGVEGLNFHNQVDAAGCLGYAATCLAADGRNVLAQPLYDGLLLAHDMGTGPLLPVVLPSASVGLRVDAVRHADGSTAVLLDNQGPTAVRVVLHAVAGAGRATSTTMTDAGGPSARSGIVLAKGTVGVRRSTGTTPAVVLVVAPDSAEVLTLPSPTEGAVTVSRRSRVPHSLVLLHRESSPCSSLAHPGVAVRNAS